MSKTVHITLEDTPGDGFNLYGVYLDEAGEPCNPDSNGSPAHRAGVQLIRHCETLGKGENIDINHADLRQFLDTNKEHPEPSPIITGPTSEGIH